MLNELNHLTSFKDKEEIFEMYFDINRDEEEFILNIMDGEVNFDFFKLLIYLNNIFCNIYVIVCNVNLADWRFADFISSWQFF